MTRKIVFVGDSLAGKTALLRSLTTQCFTKDYFPTVFDHFNSTIVTHEGLQQDLALWDTSGSSEFDHVRPLTFHDAAAIAICFDISRPSSLRSVTRRWIHEIRDVQPSLPLILIGCKSDMRNREDVVNNNIPQCASLVEGEDVARRISAKVYFEGAATHFNVEMFKEALAMLLCKHGASESHEHCIIQRPTTDERTDGAASLPTNQSDTTICRCCVLL